MRKLLFIVPIFITGIVSAQNLTRKAVFSKGQQLEKASVMKMTINMEMMGQSLEIANDNTITSAVEVKSTTDAAYNLASTVKRVTARASSAGQEMTYDSDKPEDANNELGKAIGGKVGKTNNITVDKKGFVTASDDTTQTDAEKAAGLMGGIAGATANPGTQVGGSFELIGNIPDRALKAGDTWSDSTSEKGAQGKVVNHYKVVSITGNEALISMDGTVARSGEMEQNGMTLNMNMTGTSKGDFTMEVGSGLVKKRSLVIDATGSLEAGGQSIPFTMKLITEEAVTKK